MSASPQKATKIDYNSDVKKNCSWTRALFLSLFLATGCGTWIGNPDKTNQGGSGGSTVASVSLAFQGTDNPGLALQSNSFTVIDRDGLDSGTITLINARLVLKEIRLKSEQDGEKGEAQFPGPYIVNLLTNEVAPSPGIIEVPLGSYQDIQMKLDKLDPEDRGSIDESDPIVNHSIYMTGTYTNTSGVNKSFQMTFELDEEFSLAQQKSNSKGVEFLEGENSLIIAFRIDKWFDFSSSETNSDGFDFSYINDDTIILNKDSEEASQKIREVIKENIKNTADFGKDQDGDGKLSKIEDDNEDNDDEEDETVNSELFDNDY